MKNSFQEVRTLKTIFQINNIHLLTASLITQHQWTDASNKVNHQHLLLNSPLTQNKQLYVSTKYTKSNQQPESTENH